MRGAGYRTPLSFQNTYNLQAKRTIHNLSTGYTQATEWQMLHKLLHTIWLGMLTSYNRGYVKYIMEIIDHPQDKTVSYGRFRG